MHPDKRKRKKIRGLNTLRPRQIKDSNDLVKRSLPTGGSGVVQWESSEPGLDPAAWMADRRAEIHADLQKYGGVLFRGFQMRDLENFERLGLAWNSKPMSYTDQSSPRSLLANHAYTSTDHPADQRIVMHNELSYSRTWPMEIMFGCLQPAQKGGQTPIADVRKVLELLSDETIALFREKGIRYLRNLVDGVGLSWRDVYQTESKAEVEALCRKNNVQFAWLGENHLQIIWQTPAFRTHPISQEPRWFNHGYFFNSHTMAPELRAVFKGRDYLPFDTMFGDGTEISVETIHEIEAAFEKATFRFDWQLGDLLLLDNMTMAHGREAFSGDRKIVVQMFEPQSEKESNVGIGNK